jgi:integrase
MRIGEALGLRHEDIAVAEQTVTVAPRVNDNGARAKAGRTRSIPASRQLMRLYADYLEIEYGDLDSDYVFVNLWSGRRGHPLTYDTAHDLVGRIRRSSGVPFDPHWFRHTYATELLRRRMPIESVSALLGHASITTTMDIYGHLSPQDARRELEAAGWLPQRSVHW